MKQVNLTKAEQERLISLLKWRLKALPENLAKRKEQSSLPSWITFEETESSKQVKKENEERIKRIENNIELYKTIFNKLA